MKTRLFLTLFGLACLLSIAKSDCDLRGKSREKVEFPDIMKNVALSYIMGVEYTVSGATQTDYYTEYFDSITDRGRVDIHIAGDSSRYIYQRDTWEAWTLENGQCQLSNITMTPKFFKDDQTEWRYFKGSEVPVTIGPSAMFKNALEQWKKPEKERNMEFMGPADDLIRGEKAIYFRRCTEGDTYVEYFFAGVDEENPFDVDVFDQKVTPLRVAYYGVSKSELPALSKQFYDIFSFQHYIPATMDPFELPKRRNCKRGTLATGPDMPDFTGGNLLLFSEVVYKKYNRKNHDLLSSYYSTLDFALDRGINHVGYHFSSWNTSKPDKDHKEPFVNAPHFIVYDMLHAYKYEINFATARCQIGRQKSFRPLYQLPENGGSVTLTDPYVLFSNAEFTYLTDGKDRGYDVNIYEAEVENYELDKDNVIPRAVISHSYLKYNEQLETSVEVRNAPTQIEMILYRSDDVYEILTFNFYGFSTRVPRERFFNIERCFKNDDEYAYVRIGFDVESKYLTQIKKKLPDIQANVMADITLHSELNPVRIPTITMTMDKNYLYATLLVLGKPPMQLDFPNIQENKTILVSDPQDTQGVSSFRTCANTCLEERDDCWGFSMCGATCYFGSTSNTKVETKDACKIYTKYSNGTYMPSREMAVRSITRLVDSGEFTVMVRFDDDNSITLKATVVQVSDPDEDDSMFEKMGNLLNPDMRVLLAGTKLKKGTTVKNLGKLRYDECQRLCLDFKDCETVSYCLINSECMISTKYDFDLEADEMEKNEFCNLLTRRYTTNFDRTPGVFVKVKGGTKMNLPTLDDCARACLKETKFNCLSFDHCSGEEKEGCTLYDVHYLNPKDREAVTDKSPRCGHYSRKFSSEFKRTDQTRYLGAKIDPIMNLTLEECAKTCIEYGKGACYGYDFCQDASLLATSCTILDTDPSRLKKSTSSICTNYVRTAAEYAPRPFTTSYAGGIGFVCFLVGGAVGAIAVFVIAYIRVNRGG